VALLETNVSEERIAQSSGWKVVSSWPIVSILMMEAIRSSKTAVHTRATRRHIREDGILQINKIMAAQHFQTWNAPPDYNTVFFVHKIGEF
jgi:pyridoxine 5'-phosphate synthase PdxJ